MIIRCPQCGFTGRIPDQATLVPHQARCPKCRCRFDVGDPGVQIPEPVEVAMADLRHDQARPRLDPSDSSYELDPIHAESDDSWDGGWSDEDDRGRSPTVDAGRTSGPRPPGRVARVFRPSTLRIRIFQAWAVLFMAGAAAIGVRLVVAVSRFDDARFFSDALIRPVAVVVLLVCAAALLCLYVDVSRRLSRLTYGPPPRPADRRNEPSRLGGE